MTFFYRRFPAFLFLLFLGVASSAGAQTQVLPFKAQTVYNAYLVRNLHQAYDQRQEKLTQALASPGQLQVYQQAIKQEYLRTLGPFPEKQPLRAQVTKKIAQKGFTVESLVYESRPSHYVTANLYVPAGKGKFPAVVLLNGHEMTAKATESYQKTARLLATHGFVVLSIDPFSQGERVQLTDASGKSRTRGATTEHTLLNAGANLVGTSVAAYMLWDNVRGIDYLETRPEVDASRIGAIGNSGGGTQTIYLMAYDERVKVAVPCSYFTQRARYIEVAGSQDGCQYMPGEGSLEMADFIIMSAPKPVLILAAENDFVDHRGTLKGFEELKRVYSTLQQPDKAKLFVWPDGHGISQPKREEAVAWFRRWFYQDDRPIKEGDIGALPEKELRATATGQVNTAYKDAVPVQTLSYQQFKQLAPAHRAFLQQKNLATLRKQVQEVIGFSPNLNPVFTEVSGQEKTALYTLEKRVLMRQGEMPVPVRIYRPVKASKQVKLVLRFSDKGMQTLAKNDSLVHAEVRAGNVLVLADLRGIGETLDDPKQNDPKYQSHEYRNAVLSLHLRRPLLAQRLQDLTTVLDYLSAQKELAPLPVHLFGNGQYGPVMIHATFLDERIQKTELIGSISSYETFLQDPLQKDMYSQVVQGILQFYDLPDLVQRSQKRLTFLPE